MPKRSMQDSKTNQKTPGRIEKDSTNNAPRPPSPGNDNDESQHSHTGKKRQRTKEDTDSSKERSPPIEILDSDSEDNGHRYFMTSFPKQSAAPQDFNISGPSTSRGFPNQTCGFIHNWIPHLGCTTQKNPPCHPNNLHYNLNHHPNNRNYERPMSSRIEDAPLNVDQHCISDRFRTQQNFNPVDLIIKPKITVYNSTGTPNGSTFNSKLIGSRRLPTLNTPNVPSIDLSSCKLPSCKYSLCHLHLNHPQRFSSSMNRPTSFQINVPNLQPGQLDGSTHRPNIESYQSNQQRQSLCNNACYKPNLQTPNSTNKRFCTKYNCTAGIPKQIFYKSISQIQRPVSGREMNQPYLPRNQTSTVRPQTSFSGNGITYSSFFVQRTMPNPNYLHISNNHYVSPTRSHEQNDDGFHQDYEHSALDITPSSSRYNNMTVLPSHSPWSQDCSNKSEFVPYTQNPRHTSVSQNPPAPSLHQDGFLTSDPPPTPPRGIYKKINGNYYRLQRQPCEESFIPNQNHHTPTPRYPYRYKSISQSQFSRPILPFVQPSGAKTWHVQTTNTVGVQTAAPLSVPNPKCLQPFSNIFTINKNRTLEFVHNCPDIAQYDNSTHNPIQQNISLRHSQPARESLEVIPANSIDQPDNASFPCATTDLPTALYANDQTVYNKRLKTTPTIYTTSAPSSLAQLNHNNNREAVSKWISLRSYQCAIDKPVYRIVLSDDDDSKSSEDSQKLVIDFDRASPRSPSPTN